MSSYLTGLVTRARGAMPAIRPVRQLRFPVEALMETRPAAEPVPHRPMPVPSDILTVPRRDAASPKSADADTHRSGDRAADTFNVVLPPRAEEISVAPAEAAPAIRPHLPETKAEAAAQQPAAPPPDVRRFKRWLETDIMPQEQKPESSDRISVVTRQVARPESLARAEASLLASAPALPDTHIHIGRVELISVASPPPRAGGAGARPAMSLEDYLRRRDGRA